MDMDVSARHNLPLALSSFIGRNDELAQLVSRMTELRLITLVGVGGCGKTRLSLEIARRVQPNFPDGCWFVECAPLASHADLVSAIAQVLQIRDQSGRTLLDTVRATIGNRSLLLLFDNCEHIIASVAPLAATLLAACPHLHILATSRERLNVPGEITWHVGALFVPEPTAAPSVVQTAEAIRLFTERTTAVQPQFVLDSTTTSLVAHICRCLDGMPLAIELAAARMAGMGIEELATRLDDCFHLLTMGSRAAPTRHQTLRATIDWSYDLLSPMEQLLLRRLAVFVGGWTLTAAESVCAADPIPQNTVMLGLLRLVDTSLVLVDRAAGRTRYRMLEMVRQYALERLQTTDEGAMLRARHFDACVHLVDVAAPPLYGGNHATSLHMIEDDLPNLRTAFTWGLENDRADDVLHMLGAIWRFWDRRGSLNEGCTWIEHALAASRAGGTDRVLALAGLGRLERLRGNLATARTHLEASIAVARAAGLTYELGQALQLLGEVAGSEGQYAEARDVLEQSLALGRSLGQTALITSALTVLGEVARAQGDDTTAESLYREALVLARQRDDIWRCSILLHNLGQVMARSGDLVGAQRSFQDALVIEQQIGALWNTAHTLTGFAGVIGRLGEPTLAVRFFGAAEHISTMLGTSLDFADQAAFEQNLAYIRTHLDEATFVAAHAAGRMLSPAQAIAEALAVPLLLVQPATQARDHQPPAFRVSGLTARECDVLRLVAQGRSNKEIAAALIISERTVNTHLVHIFAKLDVTSRAAAAAAAFRLGIVA